MDKSLGYTGHQDCAAREKHIPSALNQQNAIITAILEELNVVAKLLSPVLQPLVPVAASEGKNLAGVRETMPPVAEQISDHNNMLRTALEELRSINSRIEV